ncbi:hypothetical protein K440DRAFT_636174 [Wilcoxina mikolae CBS 423.85]|nr:hypothetical protein K440DRAFT_636174 [Wilcoxina mikolae CBS 423.85]
MNILKSAIRLEAARKRSSMQLDVFNSSAMMTRQGYPVQLKQSDMLLALNMARVAKGGFCRTTIEETLYLIKKPRTKTPRCLPWHNGTANNPLMRWRHKETGAPPSSRCKGQTPEPKPPLPGTPSVSSGNNAGSQVFEIINLPAGKYNAHFDPDMLPDEGTLTSNIYFEDQSSLLSEPSSND